MSDGTTTSADTVSVFVAGDDDAPTADAGADLTVAEREPVYLSGSGSDLEGQDLTYTWTQVAGPPVELSDPGSPTPSFEAPEGVTNTDVVFQLEVSDGTNTSADTVTVTIEADNEAPTAEAGPALHGDPGDRVTLLGSGSDPEGQGLTYTWIQVTGPPVVLDDPNAATPSFTIPADADFSSISFQLLVSDGENQSMDTVEVMVTGPEEAAPEPTEQSTAEGDLHADPSSELGSVDHDSLDGAYHADRMAEVTGTMDEVGATYDVDLDTRLGGLSLTQELRATPAELRAIDLEALEAASFGDAFAPIDAVSPAPSPAELEGEPTEGAGDQPAAVADPDALPPADPSVEHAQADPADVEPDAEDIPSVTDTVSKADLAKGLGIAGLMGIHKHIRGRRLASRDPK